MKVHRPGVAVQVCGRRHVGGHRDVGHVVCSGRHFCVCFGGDVGYESRRVIVVCLSVMRDGITDVGGYIDG